MKSLQLCMFALVVAALTALTAVAQDAPTFRIEKIEVRGARFASESVIARETLLVSGHVYSEPQLRAAMARVNRLPFVLDSSFAIEKGSDRGAYVLVITIVETKPLFVEAQSLFSRTNESRTENQESVRSGGRWFFGSSTLVHASTDFRDNYETGVTQYNLFGRPGYVTLNVRWTTNQGGWTLLLNGEEETYTYEVDPTPEIRFGFPVSGNHSIQGQWAYGTSSSSFESSQGTQSWSQRAHSGELAWVWDTTDDPVLPTDGSFWRTGPAFFVSDVTARSTGGQSGITIGDTRQTAFTTKFHHYEPVNDSVSLIYGASAAVNRYDTDPPEGTEYPIDIDSPTIWGITPEVGITTTLWPDRLTRRFGDLRWETRVGYALTRGSRNFYSDDSIGATTAIVQRNVWGTLRLGFTYTNYDAGDL